MISSGYFFICILLRSFVFASEANNTKTGNAYSVCEGVRALNPENDPIFDPVSGLCYRPVRINQIGPSQGNYGFTLHSTSNLSHSSYSGLNITPSGPSYPSASLSTQSSSWSRSRSQEPNTPMTSNYLSSEDPRYRSRSLSYSSSSSAVSYSSEISTISSISTLGSSRNRSFPYRSAHLYIPDICKNYDRMWDFFVDGPENLNTPIASISRLGYADNVIKELNLRKVNATYTLIPSWKTVRHINLYMPSSQYLEVFVSHRNLFYDLFELSGKVDKELISEILAITLTFDSYGVYCIRIIVNSKVDSRFPYRNVRGQLSSAGINVSPYYPFNNYYC